MTNIDLVHTVAVGILIASSILFVTPKLIFGVYLIFIFFAFNFVFSILRIKSKLFEKIVSNTPKFLMKDGKIIEENLQKCRVTPNEFRAKLRTSGVINLSQVKAVILETTGDVSVILKNEDYSMSDYLLKDVSEKCLVSITRILFSKISARYLRFISKK